LRLKRYEAPDEGAMNLDGANCVGVLGRSGEVRSDLRRDATGVNEPGGKCFWALAACAGWVMKEV
jgi:hypothetical protein